MDNQYRNNYVGTINESNIGQDVVLSGWVENIRDHGGVLFLDLRDIKGTLQLVSNDDNLFVNISKESVITVKGTIRARSAETVNEKIASGKVELLVESLEVLNKAKELPFEVMISKSSNEEIRLKHRYLDLRNKEVAQSILFRSKVFSYLRHRLTDLNFNEMQTPILTASSPEGARDYVVPSRKHKGKFYALPQAPQIFKQLIMVSGFDKYFQIAPCFRDEDGRSDRTPGEFYQLDLEASFVTEPEMLQLGETILKDLFIKYGCKKLADKPFPVISYNDAMLKYGTDKPDLRNPLEIVDITDIFEETTFKPFVGATIRSIVVHEIGQNSNSWFNELVAYANSIGMPGIGYITLLEDGSLKGPIDKFLSEEERDLLISDLGLKSNSVVFFIANRKEKEATRFAGLIRDELGRKLELIDQNSYEFCIINDFPMYEWDEENEKYDFTHNPFSMPQGGLDKLNSAKPETIMAYQYDFVCNGVEIISGAIRNHDINIMKKAFAIAGYDEEVLKNKFGALYKAFEYGAPPHGGMAAGLERLLMLLTNEENIREVILFPMNNNGQDLMTGAPSEVSELQLREAHIKIRD